MKTFRWTVPQPEQSDPRCMKRREFDHWVRVRRKGPEWFVVHKGLVFLALLPAASQMTGGPGFSYELAVGAWCAGLLSGALVWRRRESRFERTREAGMSAPGDDLRD